MARVSGKCPCCGQVIHVNDERERGHCGKCGAEISTQEAIHLLNRGSSTSSTEANQGQPQTDPLRQQRRAERAREKAEKEQDHTKQRVEQAQNEAASQKIYNMFQLCTNEQDFLMLRSKIMAMDLTDDEKALLLNHLDRATGERLEDALQKAEDYAESQGSPTNSILGAVVIAGIGLLINYLFHMKIPGIIAIVLAVAAVFSDFQKRHDPKILAENKAAAELIDQYRKLGYKI